MGVLAGRGTEKCVGLGTPEEIYIQCLNISASIYGGIYGNDYSARQRRPPFERLVRVVQETSKITESVARAIGYFPELKSKTLVLMTGHNLHRGL